MGLYHGVTGILCFYAALFSKTGEDKYKRKIIQYYDPIKRKLKNARILLNSESASLNHGVSGILLALYHIGELTGISDFINDAEELAKRIIIPKVLDRRNTDVLGGYAGLAIALRKIRDKNNAKRISEALLPILGNEEPLFTGYAHGASGYSLAIGILVSILGDISYNDKILELIQWENTYYDSRIMNWRDLRSNQIKCPTYMNGWCSGTPGIVMARQQLFNISDDNRIKDICKKDIISTEEWFKVCPLEDHDNLCCGNSAKIMAASQLGINTQTVYDHIIKAIESKCLNLQHLIGTSDFIPGLMQGYAGIGYSLTMYGDKRNGGMLI